MALTMGSTGLQFNAFYNVHHQPSNTGCPLGTDWTARKQHKMLRFTLALTPSSPQHAHRLYRASAPTRKQSPLPPLALGICPSSVIQRPTLLPPSLRMLVFQPRRHWDNPVALPPSLLGPDALCSVARYPGTPSHASFSRSLCRAQRQL